MQLIDKIGYALTWNVMIILSLISCALLIYVMFLVKKESDSPVENLSLSMNFSKER